MNRRILAATAAIAMLLTGLLPGAVFARAARDRATAAPRQPSSRSSSTSRSSRPTSRARSTPRPEGGHAAPQQVARPPQGTDRRRRWPPGRRRPGGAGPPRSTPSRRPSSRTAKRLDSKARVLGQTQRATNVVALQIDASQDREAAKAPNVVSIDPVVDYQKALSETVPYIGATTVQTAGYNGPGRARRRSSTAASTTRTSRSAGPAPTAAYEAAYGTEPDDSRNTTLDGLFPTSRVKGGFDFVGESWPVDDDIEDPDPDPIDLEGHGTHVADIIGGTQGVAPKVSLYAVKVCSSVDTACTGVGAHPGHGLGGRPERRRQHQRPRRHRQHVARQRLRQSLRRRPVARRRRAPRKLGMLTVAAAGNGGNKPRTSPARRPTPRAPCRSPRPRSRARRPSRSWSAPRRPSRAPTPNTETVDWAPLGATGFAGDVVYVGQRLPGRLHRTRQPGGPVPRDPTGKVALIDRGACSVSLKVERAAKAGADGRAHRPRRPRRRGQLLVRRRRHVRPDDGHPASR